LPFSENFSGIFFFFSELIEKNVISNINVETMKQEDSDLAKQIISDILSTRADQNKNLGGSEKFFFTLFINLVIFILLIYYYYIHYIQSVKKISNHDKKSH
jgi:hypothetical protein